MAKISCSSGIAQPQTSLLLVVLLFLLLAVAAESVGSPVAAAAAVADDEARAISVKILDRLREIFGGLPDRLEKVLEMMFPRKDGEERSAGRTKSGGAVVVVNAGSKGFSALVVDVTSAVTWTSQCGGGQRRVPCGDPLCKQYGGAQQPSCGCGGAGTAQACSAGKDALLQGNVSLSTSDGQRVFAGEDTVYACRPGESSGDYAIIGLGRGSVLANSSKTFSYLVDSNLRSFVWHGNDAEPPGRRSTTQLISVADSPDMDPSLYYVNITGIKVGDGSVSERTAATTAILTTTIPFTFLNPELFDHLKQELRTTAAKARNGSDLDASFEQLCYPKETKLPAITLVFAGKDTAAAAAAAMELEPEHYSYKKSNGMVCLSILRSPRVSISIIGSMLQTGRRMTYNLDDETLTFDLQASKPSSASASSPPSSTSSTLSRSSSAAVTPVFPISSACLSLLLAMMIM